MASWALLAIAFAAINASYSEATKLSTPQEPTVRIAQGTLRGLVSQTADNTTYYKFLKIPFAQPPLGSLRFASPKEPSSWSGVRDATKSGRDCLQLPKSGSGSEDCLYINVYTPQIPSSDKNSSLMPVMVHIHGGAFVTGSANAWPGQLMDYGVVMASISYRLNLFGFMSIEGTDAPGNAGLKDQLAGLRWIKKNIAHFGGDPNSVTIMGESAGGASVHYHILSSQSKGLFHRAISESGSALNSFAFVQNTQQSAFQLSALVGRPAHTTSQLINNLRAASASELIEALNNVTAPLGSERPFAPCIEFVRAGEEPFLRQSPASLVRAGHFASVPYIAGSAKNEAAKSYQNTNDFWKTVNGNLEEYLVPYDLGLARGSAKSKEVAEKVKKFYFGNDSISYSTREKWVESQTDIKYSFDVVTTVHAHAKYSSSKTYNYQLTFGAATHAMEWHYVIYGGKVQGETSSVALFSRSLGQLWTSFAKTGVPTADGGVTWKPVSTTSYPYLDLNTPTSLKYDMDKDRMDFWFNIYETYRNASSAF